MKRTDLKLPDHALLFQGVPHYTADQMREYGRACERAAYERAARLCAEWYVKCESIYAAAPLSSYREGNQDAAQTLAGHIRALGDSNDA